MPAPPPRPQPGHRGIVETPLYTATKLAKRVAFPVAVAGCKIVHLLLAAGAALPSVEAPAGGARAGTNLAELVATFAGKANDQALAEALIAAAGLARAPLRGAAGAPPLADALLLESMSERPTLPFVQFCLAQGADPNCTSRDGTPPLMLLGRDSRHAAAEDRELAEEEHAALAVYRTWEIAEIARALVEAGADVRYRAPEAFDGGHCAAGRTPLHAACERGNAELVQVLLQHGADVSAEDDEGNSPIEEAARCRRSEILALLLPAGALKNEKHVVSVLRACAASGDAGSFLTVLFMAPAAPSPRPFVRERAPPHLLARKLLFSAPRFPPNLSNRDRGLPRAFTDRSSSSTRRSRARGARTRRGSACATGAARRTCPPWPRRPRRGSAPLARASRSSLRRRRARRRRRLRRRTAPSRASSLRASATAQTPTRRSRAPA